ncbi:MAG: glycosyltransferase family protein [Anaerolineae bacterium]
MKVQTVVCYSLSLPDQESMAYIRFIAPCRQAGIHLVDGMQNGCAVPDRVIEGDVVIIQRQFPQRFHEYQEIIKIARHEQKPVVFDLDDLLFFLPEDHPDRLSHSFSFALLPMLQALLEANVVTVSTSRLRDVLINYNENVVVLPNYFDDALWCSKHPTPRGTSQQDVLTIGYMGTNSHKPDLEYIAPVLLRLLDRYFPRLSLRFWGTPPPLALHSYPQVQWTPLGIRSYPEFMKWFQAQSADIFIAPLVDNLFNRCKSPLKFFEYSALGVPGIYSRLDPYENIVRHGYNGLLATTLAEWEECLARLIEDDALRIRLATEAQATIKEKWFLSQNISRWLEVFHNALRVGRGDSQDSKAILNVVRSINLQLFEASQALAVRISEQAQTIQEQAQKIQQLESEILGYVLSRSWRLTRPFRRMSRVFKRPGRK